MSQDLDALYQGAMFMTEQGAGSDISATAVRAEPQHLVIAASTGQPQAWIVPRGSID